MVLSIVCPTLPGRERELARTREVYERLTPVSIEWLIEHGHENCGAGWNAGAAKATGEILHMASDDLEPESDEWFWAAYETLRRGDVPLGWVREDEASVFGRDFCRVVICRREWWQPVIEQQYWCVPTDHRALSREGWCRHDELRVGDPVMVFDPLTHEMRWEPLLGVNVEPYVGPLHVIERKGDRWECTPNHRWPIERMHTGRREWMRRIVESREMHTGDRIPIRGDFRGGDSCLSPRLAAIFGWVCGDGSYYRDTQGYMRMLVYQSERKFLKEAIEALGRNPIRSKIGKDVCTIYVGREDRRAIEQVARSKADAPRVAASLSRDAAEAMMDALILAEGWQTKAGGQLVGQSPTANLPICEAIQILALLTGRNASVPRGDSKAMFLKSSAGLSVAEARRTDTHYQGEVWCPRTPTGTWIMEHDGGAIPTGNSDNHFTDLMHDAGHDAVIAPGFDFYHRKSMVGRDESRMEQEREAYLAAR